MAIVAVFSGAYCHGDEIARQVTERLKYGRIDDKLLREASVRFGVAEEKLARAMTGSATFFNKYTRERERNIARLKTTLAQIVLEDNQLLHGYAGHLLPDSISHVLKVCVIANHDYRVSQVVKTESKSEKDAQKVIHNDDKERLEWTKLLFDRSPYDEDLYDLVIPMHDTTIDKAVALVCEHAQGDALKTTPDSRQEADDFALAAAVNLVLVEAGHDMGVVCKSGRVTITVNEFVTRLQRLTDEVERLASAVPGVTGVGTQTGPNFRLPSLNPWLDVEVPPKILLVDDEKEYVHALSDRLQTRDIGTSVVYDGESALDFVAQDQPDVMVLDLQMPGIDGIEVLRRIKKDRPRIQVIILTGHGSQREERLAEELGAFAYLQKPVNIDDLAEIMKKAYEKVSLQEESSVDDGESRGDGDSARS
ncbi:MAG: cytidylate kinase-like family protein [Planctomycetota bacterium]|jgi:CheY-like chemotaxis protein